MRKVGLIKICGLVGAADMGTLVEQKGKKALTLDQLKYLHTKLREIVEEKLEKKDETKLEILIVAGIMLENYIERKLQKKCKKCILKNICAKYDQKRTTITVEKIDATEAIRRLEEILRSATGMPESVVGEDKSETDVTKDQE